MQDANEIPPTADLPRGPVRHKTLARSSLPDTVWQTLKQMGCVPQTTPCLRHKWLVDALCTCPLSEKESALASQGEYMEEYYLDGTAQVASTPFIEALGQEKLPVGQEAKQWCRDALQSLSADATTLASESMAVRDHWQYASDALEETLGIIEARPSMTVSKFLSQTTASESMGAKPGASAWGELHSPSRPYGISLEQRLADSSQISPDLTTGAHWYKSGR